MLGGPFWECADTSALSVGLEHLFRCLGSTERSDTTEAICDRFSTATVSRHPERIEGARVTVAVRQQPR